MHARYNKLKALVMDATHMPDIGARKNNANEQGKNKWDVRV